MDPIVHAIFEPGLFSNAPVRTAVVVGGVAAVGSGIVGVFTVMRGQSFAGHALSDVSAAGGSAAYLIGISPLLGFVGLGAIAAAGMEMIGVRKAQGGSLPPASSPAPALAWLHSCCPSTAPRSTTGAAITVLFGSMFAIASSTVPLSVAFSLVTVIAVALFYRPLLLSTLSPELAVVRGVWIHLTGLAYLLVLAVAVALSALTVGAILSTALLIVLAAIALHLARRPGWAALIGLAATWIGILLAYDSSYSSSSHQGWPVSFFVVTLIFLVYLCVRHPRVARARASHRQGTRRPGPELPAAPRLQSGQAVAGNGLHVATDDQGGNGVRRFHDQRMDRGLRCGRRGRVLRGGPRLGLRRPRPPPRGLLGAAAASLIDVNTLVGLAVFSAFSALGISWLGRRAHRDVTTGLLLVVLLGLGALFLSMTTEYAPEISALLFGEALAVGSNSILPVALLAAFCLVAVAVLYRPLLLTPLAPELGEACGVHQHRVQLLFLLVLGTTTTTLPVVGALLVFSLMVGPPAAAARSFTNVPSAAIVVSVAIALGTVWTAIALSYVSDWPVGFFVGGLGALS